MVWVFLWLKIQLFDLFYVSWSFTLVVCGGKISPNLTNSKDPEPQGAAFYGAWRKKKWGAGASWKKRIAVAGAAWKKREAAGSPALENIHLLNK